MTNTDARVQRIVPGLWFARTAVEAVEGYVAAFTEAGAGETSVVQTSHYPTEGLAEFQQDFAGDVLEVRFRLAGLQFSAINAGDEVRPNPSISFMVFVDPAAPDAAATVDRLFERLSDGGGVLMPLAEYPFSPRFGWVADRYGVTWQIMLGVPGVAATRSEIGKAQIARSDAGESGAGATDRPTVGRADGPITILPALMFPHGRDQATPAAQRYVDVIGRTFGDSGLGQMSYYPAEDGTPGATLMQGFVRLAGQDLVFMDSGAPHAFTFDLGVSLLVQCDTQEQVDIVWDSLSADPDAEMCGWLKDESGISWQVSPRNMTDLMRRPGAWQVMASMKKPVLADFLSLPEA